ncbi:MAG: hypothetical protein E7624_03595 [Ruminococcaceae bacterium]|nr:hypothetical protein [Oscillospiraceae bacterium]
MMKRAIALLLCLITLLLCVTACSKDEQDKGAYIRMFLTEPIYDFDPLQAFDNADDLQIVSLLFAGLFYADANGEPQPDLVEEYEYVIDEEEERYYLTLHLKTTNWSDGVQLSATHVQYAFRRLFYADVSHPATALLYDIKNARAIVSGDASVDHLQVTVVDSTEVEIEFEKDIDVDAFLKVLCSPALFPMRDDIVEFNADWAKKTTTMVCSGPFMVRRMDYDVKDGFILERNSYYYRDRQEDEIDKYVTPFRLIADFTTPVEEQLAHFDTGAVGSLYYLGNIPMAARTTDAFNTLLQKGELTDAPATHMYYLNQKAVIGDKALFADAKVRKALSLVLDRDAIAKAIVFAKAADGFVPPSILNQANDSETFREVAEQSIATSPNKQAALDLLQEAGIVASDYSFAITVAAYDSAHLATAELVKAAWISLGFNVTLRELGVEPVYIENAEDPSKREDAGYVKDLYKEALDNGDFEVIALDYVATGVDAFSYLAPFATAFSGNAMDMDSTTNPGYKLNGHITGYKNRDYNAKIGAAFDQVDHEMRPVFLHAAEAILLEDMPAIPVFYNQNFALASDELSGIEASFFCNAVFIEASLDNYWEIALAEFVEKKENAAG